MADINKQPFKRYAREVRYCPEPGCGYSSGLLPDIDKHMRTHTKARPFACQYPGCGYAATQPSNLKTHMRIHTGERPFACDVAGCGYTATQRVNLVSHKRRVHKE